MSPSSEPRPEAQGPSRALAWILGLATVFKLALLPLVADMRQRGDELQYARGAESIALTGVPDYGVEAWDVAHWGPVYPYLLGGLRAVLDAEAWVLAVRVTQVLLSTLTAYCVYRLALATLGRRVALVSAAAVSFFPTAIAYTHFVLCETLFTALFLALAALLVVRGPELDAKRALLAGLVGGVAALTRSAFVYQAFLIALGVFWSVRGDRARRLRVAGAFLGGVLLALAPWTLTNALRFGGFLLVDTNGGNVLHKNWNTVLPENHDYGFNERYKQEVAAKRERGEEYRGRRQREDFIARNDAEVRDALHFVLGHPRLFAHHTLVRGAELVNPTSYLVRALRFGDYRRVPAWLEEALVALVLVTTMALLALGTLGCLVPRADPRRRLCLVLLASALAPCLLVVAESRYRFPLEPLLIPFAVDAALRARSEAYRTARARWGAALLVLALLAWAWIRYVPSSYGPP